MQCISYPYSFWQEEEGQQSLECIQANQIFPRKPPVLDDDDLQVSGNQDHCQDECCSLGCSGSVNIIIIWFWLKEEI